MPLQSWSLRGEKEGVDGERVEESASHRKFALVNIIYSLSFRSLLIPLVFRHLSVTWHEASEGEQDGE